MGCLRVSGLHGRACPMLKQLFAPTRLPLPRTFNQTPPAPIDRAAGSSRAPRGAAHRSMEMYGSMPPAGRDAPASQQHDARLPQPLTVTVILSSAAADAKERDSAREDAPLTGFAAALRAAVSTAGSIVASRLLAEECPRY